MTRHTLHALTALSLLLCLATAALWARSHWVGDKYEWQPPTTDRRIYRSYRLASAKGNLTFHWSGSTFDRPLRPDEEDAASYVQNSLQRGYSTRPPASLFKHYWPVPLVDSPRRFLVWHVDYPVKHDGSNPPLAERYEWHTYACPHAAIVLLTALLPAAMIPRLLLRHRQAARRAAGLCPRCGYDMRATPARCPECGQPFTPPAST